MLKITHAKNYTCQKLHMLKITHAKNYTCQKLHFP